MRNIVQHIWKILEVIRNKTCFQESFTNYFIFAFAERHPKLGYGFESRLFCRRSMDGWILGRTSGIPRRFFRRDG